MYIGKSPVIGNSILCKLHIDTDLQEDPYQRLLHEESQLVFLSLLFL